MRLDRWLAHAGIGTRSEVKAIIKKGRVCVNDTVVKRPNVQVRVDIDCVDFDGQTIAAPSHVVLAMNKPKGVVSARRDARNRTVIDCLPTTYQRRDLHVAGRLDKDVSGLVILTNDTALVHEIISPAKHVHKTYDVVVDQGLPPREAFLKPRRLKDGRNRLYIPKPPRILRWEGTEARVALCEGKFHQVKRMFEAIGVGVVTLKRVAIGSLTLGDLSVGETRVLNTSEVASLFNAMPEKER